MKKIVLGTTSPDISKREKQHHELAREAAREGIVLLKNEGMLPLKCKKLALYGSGARQTVAGGTGSGAMHPRHTVGIEEGLESSGVTVLSKSWLDRYDAHYAAEYAAWKARIEEKIASFTDLYRILGVISHDRFVYPTGIPVENSDLSNETENALYVITRQAGEGADRKDEKADYRLDDVEYENLKTLCAHYKNVCVVVNVGGFLDLSFLDELPINALLFLGQGGQAGGSALADLLLGKVSPSGRLTASWPKALSDLPSTSTFSEYGDPKEQNFTEGIYVGYRYFDAFGKTPRFAFGYGLSYTHFSHTACVSLAGGTVLVGFKGKNLGRFAGKEVLQVYAGIPKGEVKRLVAFGKTDVVGVGDDYKLMLSFPVRDLAVYDEARSAYILSAGEYPLFVGGSSDALTPVALLRVGEERLVEQCTPVCPFRGEFQELTPPTRAEKSYEGVPVLDVDLAAVPVLTHDYTPLPPKEDECAAFARTLSEEELATLLVGADVRGEERLVNVMGASGSTTSGLYESRSIPNIVLSDGPQGLNVTPEVVELPDGSFKSTQPYPQYDFGFFGKMMRARMLAKPEDGVCHYQYATAWPCGLVRAQTWNTALMERLGDALGKEMEELGVTVWLAPGMNLLRNPLCGRTFEYCSEDPVLSGEIAAATVRGVQKHEGKGCSIKHFACNNSEFERVFSSSNIKERALRELYLKGFRIAVQKSAPMTVMASYNKINGVYNTNNYDLLTKVLRQEWGFENAVISDWDSVLEGRGDLKQAHAAGCDLVMPGSAKQAEALAEALRSGEVNREDCIRSAARILKLIAANRVVPFAILNKQAQKSFRLH